MTRIKAIVLLLSFFFTLQVSGQVLVNVKIDSLQFFIGEQTELLLDVTLDSKQKMQLPSLKKGDELVPNVEVVEVHQPDTAFLDDGKRLEICQKYTITAWDSALYCIPAFKIKVDGKEYLSKTLAIKVYTVDVDTLHLDRFFPPNGVMSLPFSWYDWHYIVLSAFLVSLLLILSVILYYHVVNGKPIVRFIRKKKILPPHKVALDEINRLKVDRKWAEEDSKEYYTELTDTLRTYIKNRYGFNAMEMTSEEIIEHLVNENDEESLNELRDIFTTADLVKFAKHNTLINENDANLMSALEYINQTKLEVDPNTKQEPEIIKETDQKRMNQVNMIKLLITVFLLLSCGLIAWGVWRSIDLLM